MMPEIVRVKVYDAAMRVIWSDEARLIGTTFPDNPQLRSALGGRTTVNLEVGERKEENVFEREEKELVEVYVPIAFAGNPRVVGVAETYKEPTQVFANIQRGQITVVATALGGGALLYRLVVLDRPQGRAPPRGPAPSARTSEPRGGGGKRGAAERAGAAREG